MAAIGVICCGVARGQIAPGPLSRAHADLGGLLNCTSCHGLLGRGLKCLDCHVEIKRRVEAHTGYHARAYKDSAGNCASCHAEHRGGEYVFIPLDRKTFDHSTQTGFTLEGKHRGQKCESCHNETKIAAAARSEIQVKDLNRSFLGLSRECTSCHQEPHEKQLGSDCLRCHTPLSWKPASKFSHSSTAFPLTGLHQQAPCEKCHPGAETAFASTAQEPIASATGSSPAKKLLFKGLPFDGCRSCHTSPHRGAFEDLKLDSRCEACHNTGGWRNNRPGKVFNHNLTKFHLAGKHAELSCDKCHKNGDFKRPSAHELCGNCHEDPHRGQFQSRATGSDCSACHSPADFKPSLFDRETHKQSAFPLEGKHSTLACLRCHQPEGRETLYRTGKLFCADCHVDPHGGEFASEPYNNRCDKCHTPAGFETTTFTLERHAQTRFPLTGQHAEVACRNCHKPLSGSSRTALKIARPSPTVSSLPAAGASAAPEARSRYRFDSSTCDVCHADPHEIDPKANLPCKTCHSPQQLNVLLPFDHSDVGIKLEGAHLVAAKSVDCAECHKPSGQADAAAAGGAPVFSEASARCSTCHMEEDPHGGQFSRPGNREEDCSSCHIPVAWNASVFDHETISFILSGAHRKVACAKCHTEVEGKKGKMVRLYRGTPVECQGCH